MLAGGKLPASRATDIHWVRTELKIPARQVREKQQKVNSQLSSPAKQKAGLNSVPNAPNRTRFKGTVQGEAL